MTTQSGSAAPSVTVTEAPADPGPTGSTTPGSLGDALGAVSRDLSELVRQEIELAKAEARHTAMRAGRSVGLLAGAAVAAVFTLLFVSFGLWAWLDTVMDDGWAAVVVAVVWAVAGAVLALAGRRQLRAAPGLEQTTQSVREIPRALKGEETTR